MNKDDVKKLDEITAEEVSATAQELSQEDLDQVNAAGFKPKSWWIKGKETDASEDKK